MTKGLLITALSIAAGGTVGSLSEPAFAAWPSGSVRTTHGLACTPFVNAVDSFLSYCPFISDYISGSDSHYAPNNASTYVDYHVQSTSSGASTSWSSCRQRWTGASAYCGSTTSTSGTGYHDLGVYSFGTLGGTYDQYDYYYLSVSTTESVDVIYGVSYF